MARNQQFARPFGEQLDLLHPGGRISAGWLRCRRRSCLVAVWAREQRFVNPWTVGQRLLLLEQPATDRAAYGHPLIRRGMPYGSIRAYPVKTHTH